MHRLPLGATIPKAPIRSARCGPAIPPGTARPAVMRPRFCTTTKPTTPQPPQPPPSPSPLTPSAPMVMRHNRPLTMGIQTLRYSGRRPSVWSSRRDRTPRAQRERCSITILSRRRRRSWRSPRRLARLDAHHAIDGRRDADDARRRLVVGAAVDIDGDRQFWPDRHSVGHSQRDIGLVDAASAGDHGRFDRFHQRGAGAGNSPGQQRDHRL